MLNSGYNLFSPFQSKFHLILLRIFLPLPGYDKLGRKVVLLRQRFIDPVKMSLDDLVITNTAFLEFIGEGDDQAQIMGLVLINDLANTTAGQARLFNPVTAKKAITLFQEAYPSRPKVNIIHNNNFVLIFKKYYLGNALC